MSACRCRVASQRVNPAAVWAVLLAVACGCAVVGASGADAPASPGIAAAPLTRQRDLQEQARAMAKELISSVLDVQLRQLEENGLGTLPVHAEIAAMRGNIEGLVRQEMRGVVDLLVEAEKASGQERQVVVKRAQEAVRRIALQLAAERRQLLRRLKIADIAAQARRLIREQTIVTQSSELLPRQPEGQREAGTLTTLEQQRTVKSLFTVLVDTLQDVRTWDGAVGAGAADGLRRLQDAKVAAAFDASEDRLGALDFRAAVTAQRQVLAGLTQLLESVERAQGLANQSNPDAVAAARALADQARQLRDEIAKAPLDERGIETLVEKQSQFRSELNELGKSLGNDARLEPLAEQAREAAGQAATELFEGDREEAVTEQGKAAGALTEIADRLEQAGAQGNERRSAEELARRVDDLRKAAAELAEAARQPTAAHAAAKTDPQAAAAAERQFAAALPQIAKGKDLPETVAVRLDDATRSAQDAAEALDKAARDAAARPQGEQAAAAAQDAAARAQQEVATALADAQRAQLATKIGELSRAAEAVERAAATERDLAQQVAAQPQQANAAALGARQQDVADVATKVAEAVQSTAPQAAAQLTQAQPSLQNAQSGLESLAAAQQPAQATEVAAQANQAAAALEQAARQLRDEAAKAAQQLAQAAAEQLAAVAAAPQATGDQAARQAQLERDQALAAGIAERFGAQEQARAAIETLSEQLAANASSPSQSGQSPQPQSGQQPSGQQPSGQQPSGQQPSG
ncbi:MAG: hypothetical protein DWI03_09280, partial [Planctomycetota bacterium]